MRIADRAVETRPVGVDPPPRPHASRSTRLESRGRRASRDQMLRRGRLGLAGQKPAPLSQPSFGGEESLPHARQDRQASSVSRPLEGRQRPKKPGPSLLQVASPVWRGAPVRLRLPVFARAVDWPLVQIPADRHTTTGTCVLGKTVICANRPQMQAVFSTGAALFRRCRKRVINDPPAGGAMGAPSAPRSRERASPRRRRARAIDDRSPVRRNRRRETNAKPPRQYTAEYLPFLRQDFMSRSAIRRFLRRIKAIIGSILQSIWLIRNIPSCHNLLAGRLFLRYILRSDSGP